MFDKFSPFNPSITVFEDAQPMLLIACFFKTQNLFLIASAGALASRRFPVLGFSLARKT